MNKPWLVRMHHRMRTASFAMVFVATSLHLAGKSYGLATWTFMVMLLLIYPHAQYWRALRTRDPIQAEVTNLLIDSILLGIFIAAVGFSDWLTFSVMMGTLSNNAANRGLRGIRDSLAALLLGAFVGSAVGGFNFSPHTNFPATLFCIVGLGGYLLAMNNIGFSRNQQLRTTRKQLEAHKRELLNANETHLKNFKEIEELQQQLREQANRDPLTNLYNRRFLDTTLARELARCSRDGKPLSLIMIDIDHFKKYNDHYGHQAGDQCLKSVAQTLEANAKRASDLAARYGGEEFSLVLAETDAATAMILAEGVCQAVESLQLPHEMAPTGVITISVGVATSTSDVYQDADALLRAADVALYRAKHNGRNQVQSAPNVPRKISAGSDEEANSVRLVWNDAYACGQEAIDDAHRELFSTGNLILDKVVAGSSSDEVVRLIDDLLHRIDQHFHEEDTIIASSAFPGAEEHAVAHRKLMEQSNKFAAAFRANSQDIGEFSRFLAHDVVARHMLEMDRTYFPYLPARSTL